MFGIPAILAKSYGVLFTNFGEARNPRAAVVCYFASSATILCFSVLLVVNAQPIERTMLTNGSASIMHEIWNNSVETRLTSQFDAPDMRVLPDIVIDRIHRINYSPWFEWIRCDLGATTAIVMARSYAHYAVGLIRLDIAPGPSRTYWIRVPVGNLWFASMNCLLLTITWSSAQFHLFALPPWSLSLKFRTEILSSILSTVLSMWALLHPMLLLRPLMPTTGPEHRRPKFTLLLIFIILSVLLGLMIRWAYSPTERLLVEFAVLLSVYSALAASLFHCIVLLPELQEYQYNIDDDL